MSKHTVPLSSDLSSIIGALFNSHHREFLLYAYRLCSHYGCSPMIAGDMVMDTFFKVLNGNLKIDLYPKAKAVATFKLKIRSNFIDHCRKEKSIKNCNIQFVEKYRKKQSIEFTIDLNVQNIWERIEDVLDAEKELPIFRDYHLGVQYNEMAILHGLNPNTLATKIRRIKCKLQSALQEERY